jgi:hypothetical protein
MHSLGCYAVQEAAEAVVAGATPGVSTIAQARSAAIAGAKNIMRFQNHSMRMDVVSMLKKDIRPLMEVQQEPSVNELFQFWIDEASAGVNG